MDIDKGTCDFRGPKYFAPFAKRTASPSHSETSNMLYTAPLHFIFPLTKYLPIGVFNYLNVDIDTESTCVTQQCDANKRYTFNANEQLWLKMLAPNRKQGNLYKREIDGLHLNLKTILNWLKC